MVWQRRRNKEVIYKEPIIEQMAKAQRIRWLEHVYWMPDERHAKNFLEEDGRKMWR